MNEELVQEEPVTEVTENAVEQPAEEVVEGIELTDTASNEEKKEVKEYTDEEIEKLVNDKINDLLPKKLEREKKKLEKNMRDQLSEYEEIGSILKVGLDTSDMTEVKKKLRDFYQEQGVNIPAYEKPRYSEDDELALGEIDANKIIALGFDEMQEEANRLAHIGLDKMTPREKVTFTKLANELTYSNQKKELAQIGVKEDILNDSNFKEFASQFNPKTPIKTVYEMYAKINPLKKEVEQIGSMKSNKETLQKDHYTNEEIAKMTPEEVRKNFDVIRKSMTAQN